MSDKDILKDALERFRESEEGTDYNRTAYEEDTKFARLGKQWPDNVRKQRESEARPCLTINKLPAFIRQVVNDARQNKPGIGVHPVDNGADLDTAEVIGGLIRSVERHSRADIAYDTAFDHAVTGGFGFFRIDIDYAHEDSFDLEARIRRISNPLSVNWDHNSVEFDSSDWDFGFVSDFLTKDQFKATYPKAKPVSFEGDMQDLGASWMQDDLVRVAEYWERTEATRKLMQIKRGDGSVVSMRRDVIPKKAKEAAEAGGIDIGSMDDDELIQGYMDLMGMEVVAERDAKYFKVTRRMLSGAGELTEVEDWPGSTIPIIPVWGEEVVIDGKRHFRSMIRDAKDPASMFNFWRTASTELVALAPKAPFLMEDSALPEDPAEVAKWANANVRSYPYLLHAHGSQRPQRQPFAGVPAGVIQEGASASDDMKSIMSIYDSSLGARSNETSGKAIIARQRESDVSNFHFVDNLRRSIQSAGMILAEIIPAVYTPRQSIRILGEDMKEKVVGLVGEGREPEIDENGEPEKLYDLSVGKYDIEVKSGPSFSTQREETRETLIELMRAVPASAQFIGDVLLEHMDFQGADKVAKRLQALLPPLVQQAEGLGQVPAPGQQVPGMPPNMPPPNGGLN